MASKSAAGAACLDCPVKAALAFDLITALKFYAIQGNRASGSRLIHKFSDSPSVPDPDFRMDVTKVGLDKGPS